MLTRDGYSLLFFFCVLAALGFLVSVFLQAFFPDTYASMNGQTPSMLQVKTVTLMVDDGRIYECVEALDQLIDCKILR